MKNESPELGNLNLNPLVLFYSKAFRIFALVILLFTFFLIQKEWQYLKMFAFVFMVPVITLVMVGLLYAHRYKLILSQNEIQKISLFGNSTISISSISYFNVKKSINGGNESGPMRRIVFYDKEGFALIEINEFLENWNQVLSWAQAHNIPEQNL